MLQKSLDNQKKPSGLLLWLLTGTLFYAGYTLISRSIIPPNPDQLNALQTASLRATALEVERQLASILSEKVDDSQVAASDPGFSDYKQQRFDLIQRISRQASINNYPEMASELLELARLSIDSLEFIDAELYLEEALEIAWIINSPQLKAQSYQQLGHLNIKKRNLARRSAYAYDSLLVVRNRIALGQFINTESILDTIIADNLAIRRHGAAASALETKAAFHEKVYDYYQANQAYIQAAELWAISGAAERSRKLLNSLHRSEIDEYELSRLRDQIDSLALNYERDKHNSATAQDLRRLYYLYKERGEDKKAWEFRLKANKLMLKTSDQAMYARQPDVLAVLYKSNTAIEKANLYLSKAADLFSQHGMQDQLEKTESMKNLVF